MVTAGAAPFIVYAFQRVHRSSRKPLGHRFAASGLNVKPGDSCQLRPSAVISGRPRA
jgi:hypothetical protein